MDSRYCLKQNMWIISDRLFLQMLNTSSNFLVKAKNKTGDGDDALFTEAEVEMLEKKLSEVQSWRDEAVAAQVSQKQ